MKVAKPACWSTSAIVRAAPRSCRQRSTDNGSIPFLRVDLEGRTPYELRRSLGEFERKAILAIRRVAERRSFSATLCLPGSHDTHKPR